MMAIDQLAEAKIKRAIDQGEFRGLLGEGRRLDLGDDALVPEELRVAYRLLKNAGFVPAELALRREISDVYGLLCTLDDGRERCWAMKRLNMLKIRLEMSRGQKTNIANEQPYVNKLWDRFEGR